MSEGVAGTNGTSGSSGHERVNVLLVDDQPGKLLSYEAVLGELGENLIRAGSAREALDCLLKNDVAVILIDVCMPEFDGFDLVDMIRQHPRFDTTAIILVSAVFMSDVDRLRGYERGAMDYIAVPIVPEILRAKVAAFADLYRKTRQLERMNEQLEERVAERTRELESSTARWRAGEERLSLAIAAGSVATLVWELASDRVLGDERLAFFFDMDPAAVAEGAPSGRLLQAVHDEDRARAARLVAEAIESGEEYVAEFRVHAADHAVRWIRGRGRVERDAAGRAVRLSGALIDVTEQRHLEEVLREADRRKDEFLAMLGHELRNPLASARNAIEILRVDGIEAPLERWCHDMIHRQIDHLTRLVDDLLDVSRITRGQIRLRLEPIDVVAVAQQAVEASRPLMNLRHHELVVALPDRPVMLSGDTARVTQVITNLLHNAAKYQEDHGHVMLAMERDGPEVVIRVKDRGMGIPQEMQDRVFDMFTQGETSADRAQGGLGIGLALVKRLAELHGGSVQVSSAGRNCGSEFTVRLPCLAAQDAARTPQLPIETGPRARLRILVVDDNRDVVESMAVQLQLGGHHVMLANDGESGLATALAHAPDVVLLDIGLPGMDGYEVCRRLRERGFSNTIVVAVTGYGQDMDKRHSLESGFDAHLVKPVDVVSLMQLIASLPRPLSDAPVS